MAIDSLYRNKDLIDNVLLENWTSFVLTLRKNNKNSKVLWYRCLVCEKFDAMNKKWPTCLFREDFFVVICFASFHVTMGRVVTFMLVLSFVCYIKFLLLKTHNCVRGMVWNQHKCPFLRQWQIIKTLHLSVIKFLIL